MPLHRYLRGNKIVKKGAEDWATLYFKGEESTLLQGRSRPEFVARHAKEVSGSGWEVRREVRVYVSRPRCKTLF